MPSKHTKSAILFYNNMSQWITHKVPQQRQGSNGHSGLRPQASTHSAPMRASMRVHQRLHNIPNGGVPRDSYPDLDRKEGSWRLSNSTSLETPWLPYWWPTVLTVSLPHTGLGALMRCRQGATHRNYRLKTANLGKLVHQVSPTRVGNQARDSRPSTYTYNPNSHQNTCKGFW